MKKRTYHYKYMENFMEAYAIYHFGTLCYIKGGADAVSNPARRN